MPTAQKVVAPAASCESQPTDTTLEQLDTSLFPVSIRHVAGRGRGFFATRDIQAGETVFRAVPLAWAISEDWMKNTCWWCFAYNSRRGHPIKAMDIGARSKTLAIDNLPANKKGGRTAAACSRPRPSLNRYKGVFCSLECHQAAIAAHGGQEKWDSYLALLVGMEDEIQLHSSQVSRSNKARVTPEHSSSALPDGGQPRTATNGPDSTLLCESGEKIVASNYLDADFDPDDLTDDQLGEWISDVWNTIAEHGLFSDYLPDSSERELTRLIANQLCLCDALSTGRDSDTPATDWQTEMVISSAADRVIAPLEALFHVKSNETEVLRASICQIQLGPTSLDGSASTPATIAPIRLPWRPSPAQILQSKWGSSLQTVAGSYSLLERAWKRAAKSNQLGVLSHARFRGVYYREKANSFGIWDPPTDVLQPTELVDRNSSDISYDEREWVGFSIYPTAVYFNHSCAPNVSKMRHGRTMTFASNQSVQSGEELFISYGSITDPVSERRDRLRDHFFFECACERCIAESSVQICTFDGQF
ncbi:hypothetical protein H4S07_003012 [Coemansia furcata]|uniref:Uncharacterized protein n=1 Tax=Coemansia furcata TaxID=417177 RepID=A0ACC1LHY8_9FUNG|nr:hypothetical protein H4S07_003012 [Coemansia furcata]